MTKEQKTSKVRERYCLLKTMKICTACGCCEAEPNKVLCYICGEKHRIREEKRWSDMSDAKKKQRCEQIKIGNKTRYQARKAEGLCVRCGRYRAVKSHVLCIECRNKERKKYMKKNEGKITRSERSTYGLCYICGEELGNDGRKLCSKCSERSLKNLKSCTSATHPWRKDNCMVFLRKDGE